MKTISSTYNYAKFGYTCIFFASPTCIIPVCMYSMIAYMADINDEVIYNVQHSNQTFYYILFFGRYTKFNYTWMFYYI